VTYGGAAPVGLQDLVLVSNGDSLGDSLTASGGGPGVITYLESALNPMYSPADVARYALEGLYICPAGTSCLVPLPDVASTLLAYRAAIAWMHAIGDVDAAQRTEGIAGRMQEQLTPLLSERIEGEPRTIRPTLQNRGGGIVRW
jgi:hypothetical protein